MNHPARAPSASVPDAVPADGKSDPGPLPDAVRDEAPQPGGDGNEDPGSERDVASDEAAPPR